MDHSEGGRSASGRGSFKPTLNEIEEWPKRGQDIETIKRDTERDHYMTAQEAKDYGLIDDIMVNQNK